MSEKGVFNVNGKERIMFNELVQAEDLIIDDKIMMLRTKDYTFNFVKSSNSLVMKAPYKMKISLASLAVYIACRYGNLKSIHADDETNTGYKYLLSNYYNKTMRLSSYKIENEYTSTTYELVDKALNNIDFTKLKLGKARETIDDYFSFEKLLGQVLAKAIWGFPRGTIITKEVLETLYLKHTNMVYIKYKPNLVNMYLQEDIIISQLKRGIRVSNFITGIAPQLIGQGYIKEDINLTIRLRSETLIIEDINEFLNDLCLETIKVSTSKTGNYILLSFYREIKNNNTMRADLTSRRRAIKGLPIGAIAAQSIGEPTSPIISPCFTTFPVLAILFDICPYIV